MDINKRIARAMLNKSFAEAKELVFKSLYAKSSLALDEARYTVANAIFNEAELDEMAMTKARENQLGRKMVKQSTAQMRSFGTSKHPSEYRKSRELQKQYDKEDKSKKTYGINGKVVKEEAELYEMDEDFQMPERESEMRKKIKNAGKKRSEADADEFEAAVQNVSGPKKKEGHQKFVDAGKRKQSAEKQRAALVTKNREERKDTKNVYGKGGKVVGKVEKK